MQKLNLYIYGIYKSSMKQNKIFLQLVSVLHNTAFPFFFLSWFWSGHMTWLLLSVQGVSQTILWVPPFQNCPLLMGKRIVCVISFHIFRSIILSAPGSPVTLSPTDGGRLLSLIWRLTVWSAACLRGVVGRGGVEWVGVVRGGAPHPHARGARHAHPPPLCRPPAAVLPGAGDPVLHGWEPS